MTGPVAARPVRPEPGLRALALVGLVRTVLAAAAALILMVTLPAEPVEQLNSTVAASLLTVGMVGLGAAGTVLARQRPRTRIPIGIGLAVLREELWDLDLRRRYDRLRLTRDQERERLRRELHDSLVPSSAPSRCAPRPPATSWPAGTPPARTTCSARSAMRPSKEPRRFRGSVPT